MSENQKKILEFAVVILSFISILLFWDKIGLSYENTQNIIGSISYEKFNPINNDLRFIVLIFSTALIYYFFLISFYKNQNTIKDILRLKNFETNKFLKKNNFLKLSFIVVFFSLILEFIIVDLPKQNLDFFHEGEWLTPGFHLLENNDKLIDIFFIHGVFYDLVQSVIAWDLFNQISIGSVRYFNLILIFITKIFLLILIYKVSINQNLKNFKKFLIFLFLNLICLKLIRYDQSAYNYFTFRDIPLILILILSFDILRRNLTGIISSFAIGVISFSSLFFTIDRGIYSVFISGIILILLLIQKKYLQSVLLFGGFVISIIFLLIFLPIDQLKIFYENTLEILNIKPFLDNYKFPTPIFDRDTVSSKAIITIIISIILTIKILVDKQKGNFLTKDTAFFIIILFIVNIIVFKNALGRSDAAHIKYSLGFNYFLISFLALYLILKNNILNRDNNFVYLIFGFLVIFLQIFYINKDTSKLSNLADYKTNTLRYINLEDTFFLNEEKRVFLKEYSKLLNTQDCEINLTNEPAWAYLLRKETCLKYYVSWFAASDKLQENFIQIIKEKKIDVILFESKFQLLPDGLDNKNRISKIINYLEKNYKILDYGNFKIAKLKDK